MSGAEKDHLQISRQEFAVHGERSGEGRERSFLRRCGAEKLPWLVIEVEVDTEQAGCFAERQLRLGLVGEEAIPETRDRLGRPAKRTKARLHARLRVRIGAVHEGVDRGGTAQVLSHTHLNPRGRGEPPERKSDRFYWVNHRERLPVVLVREKLQ